METVLCTQKIFLKPSLTRIGHDILSWIHRDILWVFFVVSSPGFLKDCFGGFDHHRQLHLVLDSLEEIADIEMNGGKREDEEEEEPFR